MEENITYDRKKDIITGAVHVSAGIALAYVGGYLGKRVMSVICGGIAKTIVGAVLGSSIIGLGVGFGTVELSVGMDKLVDAIFGKIDDE